VHVLDAAIKYLHTISAGFFHVFLLLIFSELMVGEATYAY
jgi:hypothetical protein